MTITAPAPTTEQPPARRWLRPTLTVVAVCAAFALGFAVRPVDTAATDAATVSDLGRTACLKTADAAHSLRTVVSTLSRVATITTADDVDRATVYEQAVRLRQISPLATSARADLDRYETLCRALVK